MPDTRFRSALAKQLRAWRTRRIARALILAAASAAVVFVVAALGTAEVSAARLAAAAVFFLAAGAGTLIGWRTATSQLLAVILDRQLPDADNIIITAEEVANERLPRPPEALHAALFLAASTRLRTLPQPGVFALVRESALAGFSVVSLGVLLLSPPLALPSAVQHAVLPAGAETSLASVLRVTITPPAYTGRPRSIEVGPTAVRALVGSQVRLELAATNEQPQLVDAMGREHAFSRGSDGHWFELLATESRPLLVRVHQQGRVADRLLSLQVEPDRDPVVRIARPAQDLLFASPNGTVDITIDASDDLGLRELELRYTRVSGSGETFEFQEGQWPVQRTASSDGRWQATARVSLDDLQLQDGDTLVYRALARDGRPATAPASSETYLIEVGRRAAAASAGFALPDDVERQGLSQQMLIMKTERLLSERGRLAADAVLEQSRLLAIEQRMVKSEFVFMTGGEVEDEVEEAAHSHELVEGRLENAAQVELLNAIREMSRAEARLNAADVPQALVFERAALRALQRAFDRRRYLLRTLPERTRIDLTRRLSGERDEARSATATSPPASADATAERARQLLARLSAPLLMRERDALAAQLLALDASSETLQQAALRMVRSSEGELPEATGHARRALVEVLQARLRPSQEPGFVYDPLRGQLSLELAHAVGVRQPR